MSSLEDRKLTQASVKRFERRQPWTLPPVSESNFIQQKIVIVIDANVVIKDLIRYSKEGGTKRIALFEVVKSAHVFMSADDLKPKSGHTTQEPRLLVNLKKKKPEQALKLWKVWQTLLAPYIFVLDPSSFPATPESRLTYNNDPDDANLSLLGHVLAADGFITYDEKAFQNIHPVMSQRKAHGEYLCAFRDDLRVQEFFTLHVGLPINVLTYGIATGSQALHQRGISYSWQAAGVVGMAALLYLWKPDWLRKVGHTLIHVGNYLESHNPEPMVRAEMKERQQEIKVDWADTTDPSVRVTRYLARQTGSYSCTSLCHALQLSLKPSELFALLQQHPGVLEVNGRRQWRMRQPIHIPGQIERVLGVAESIT